jgi:hypothetical protein
MFPILLAFLPVDRVNMPCFLDVAGRAFMVLFHRLDGCRRQPVRWSDRGARQSSDDPQGGRSYEGGNYPAAGDQ